MKILERLQNFGGRLKKLWRKKFDFPRRKYFEYIYTKIKMGSLTGLRFIRSLAAKLPKNIHFLRGWRGLSPHMRIAIGIILPIMVLALLTPRGEAKALFLIDDALYYVFGKVMFGIGWIISYVGGVVVALVTWFVEVALRMSTQVVNSTPVRNGFPIALAVTNMGFVAAVIVIAIATILRYGDYVVKKTLPKLIAAALLVNFSLVFAGAILNFADQFTFYFLDQVNPTGEDTGIANFASALTGAFNPQKNWIIPNDETAPAAEGMGSAIGKDLGRLLVPITSVSLTVFTLIAIILSLFALAALLLVRYVYLVVLLIVMPFVWLLWIFPGTKSYFADWWKKFLKQVFFAPVVVFFLYLAILTAGAVSEETHVGAGTAVASPTANGVANFAEGFLVVPTQNLINSLVIVGLMFGGMFAASKIGAAGASTAQKLVMAGTGFIGMGLHARAPGAIARGLSQTGPNLPNAPQKPAPFASKGILGKIAHPFQLMGYGVKQARFAAQKTVKAGREKVVQTMVNKAPETYQKLGVYGENDAERLRNAGQTVGLGSWLTKEAFMKQTFKNIILGTFTAGIKSMGSDGHPSAEQIKKFFHLDHDDHSGGGHGGGTPHGGATPGHTI